MSARDAGRGPPGAHGWHSPGRLRRVRCRRHPAEAETRPAGVAAAAGGRLRTHRHLPGAHRQPVLPEHGDHLAGDRSERGGPEHHHRLRRVPLARARRLPGRGSLHRRHRLGEGGRFSLLLDGAGRHRGRFPGLPAGAALPAHPRASPSPSSPCRSSCSRASSCRTGGDSPTVPTGSLFPFPTGIGLS